jgi:hypothetical protein
MRPDDPALLSPEDRCHEIARLLAAGVRRLLPYPTSPAPGPDSAPAESQESCQNGLEVGGDSRLTVHTGYLPADSHKRSN